jgi:hypothetical protein
VRWQSVRWQKGLAWADYCMLAVLSFVNYQIVTKFAKKSTTPINNNRIVPIFIQRQTNLPINPHFGHS